MKRDLLQKLLAAQKAKRSAVMITDVQNGRQLLLDGKRSYGDLEPGPTVVKAAREHLQQDRSGMLEDDKHFVQVFLPPLRLAVIGAVHISQSLVPMAKLAAYEVTVIDPRRAWATEARFPDVAMIIDWPDVALETFKPDARTAVVTLTHDPKLDDPALLRALRSEAFYIGALGSKRTHAKRLERLAAEGLDSALLERIHGPAGLAIGARTPSEIALAILAEMTATLRRAPQSLRGEKAA